MAVLKKLFNTFSVFTEVIFITVTSTLGIAVSLILGLTIVGVFLEKDRIIGVILLLPQLPFIIHSSTIISKHLRKAR